MLVIEIYDKIMMILKIKVSVIKIEIMIIIMKLITLLIVVNW